MSHWYVNLLSPAARQLTRQIDRIKVAGCPLAMGVYTFDITNPMPDWGAPEIDIFGEQEPVDFTKPMYRELQDGLSEDFLRLFDQGLQHYLGGKRWDQARQCLEDALTIKDADGPTLQLLEVMDSYNMTPPQSFSLSAAENYHVYVFLPCGHAIVHAACLGNANDRCDRCYHRRS